MYWKDGQGVVLAKASNETWTAAEAGYHILVESLMIMNSFYILYAIIFSIV